MESEEYAFGIINYLSSDKEKEIVRILGRSKLSAKFINGIDEELWKDFWENKGKKVNAIYVHGQDRFDKDRPSLFSWSEQNAKEQAKDIKILIKEYYKAAKKYNEKIADPFINKRRKTLRKILNFN